WEGADEIFHRIIQACGLHSRVHWMWDDFTGSAGPPGIIIAEMAGRVRWICYAAQTAYIGEVSLGVLDSTRVCADKVPRSTGNWRWPYRLGSGENVSFMIQRLRCFTMSRREWTLTRFIVVVSA